MREYTWNIPEIYRFPIYDRYIPGIFHIYDTIQIPDGVLNPSVVAGAPACDSEQASPTQQAAGDVHKILDFAQGLGEQRDLQKFLFLRFDLLIFLIRWFGRTKPT
jgi:hypothetical protein